MKGTAFKVTGFANMILLAINAVSLAGVVLFTIVGVAGQIFGPEDAGGAAQRLHIPLSYKQVLALGFACLAIMLGTYFLRVEWSVNL